MHVNKEPSDEQKLEGLTTVAAELKDEIAKLNLDKADNIVKLGKYTKKTRRMTWGVIISLVIDLVLTLFITNNAIRLDGLTQRLDYSQTVNRQRALCPLYQLFLDSKSEAARDRAPDPAKYDQAFVTIQDGFDALGCAEFTSKPAPPFKK